MKKFDDFLVEKTVSEYATDFTLTKDTKLPEKLTAIFSVDNDTYSVVIYRSSKKGLYKVVVGWVPNEYIKLWKVKPQHLRTVIGTTLKIMDYAVDDIGVTWLSGIAMKLPDTAKPSHIKIIEMLVKKYYNSSMKFVPVTPPKDSDAKEQYVFIARKTADIKKVFRNKEFKEYDFDPSAAVVAVPQEALDDAEPARPLNLHKRVEREPLVTRGTEINLEIDNDSIKDIAFNRALQPRVNVTRTVRKDAYGFPVGFLLRFLKAETKDYTEKLSITALKRLAIYYGVTRRGLSKQTDPLEIAMIYPYIANGPSESFYKLFSSSGFDQKQKKLILSSLGVDDVWDMNGAYNNKVMTPLWTKIQNKTLPELNEYFEKEASSLVAAVKDYESEMLSTDFVEIHNKSLRDRITTPTFDAKFTQWDFGQHNSPSEYFAKIISENPEVKNIVTEMDKLYLPDNDAGWEKLRTFVIGIREGLKQKKLLGVDLSDANPKAIEALVDLINFYLNEGGSSKYSRSDVVFFLRGVNYRADAAERNNPVEENKEEVVDVDFKVDLASEYTESSFLEVMTAEGDSSPWEKKGMELLYKYHGLQKFEELDKVAFGSILKYTGSSYSDYNRILRESLKDENYLKNSDSYIYDYAERVLQMMDGYKNAKPTEEDMLVFRGSAFPGPNDEVDMKDFFVDPGFLSTSCSSSLASGFGDTSKGTKFMIILPKGSKVIFANGSSMHSNEKEIILPPYSVLKPIKVVMKGKMRYVQCIYIGNGMESYKTKLEQLFKEAAKRDYMKYKD